MKNLTLIATLMLSLGVAACHKKEAKQEEPASAPAVVQAPAAATSVALPVAPQGPALADCDKLPNPKPTDDSATGRAGAVSQGLAIRAACKKEVMAQLDKPNADLARLREIKEKEQADQNAHELSDKEFSDAIKKGGKAPIKEYKY